MRRRFPDTRTSLAFYEWHQDTQQMFKISRRGTIQRRTYYTPDQLSSQPDTQEIFPKLLRVKKGL